MSDKDESYFTPTRVAALRAEVEKEGIVTDSFLATHPDGPVSGLNLACLYSFPEEIKEAYAQLAEALSSLDPGVYVYPFWETHVTLATLVNFTLSREPFLSPARLRSMAREIATRLKPLFQANDSIGAFQLEFQAPVLTRSAVILPIINLTGEVRQIRQRTIELLQQHPFLWSELLQAGCKVPGIIHSTILRFRKPPRNLDAFLAGFDAIAADRTLGAMQVSEVLLTSETKPYMRGGKILHRFTLQPPNATRI